MKHIAKSLVRTCADCLPGPARELGVRLSPRFGKVIGGAHGEYGFIRSTPSDIVILPVYARTGTWAKLTNETLIEFFAGKGGAYFDVGANIGLTTIPVAQNPRVQCTAFEPEPVNFANLTKNVRRNARHGNVHIHQVAITDRGGTVSLGIADDNVGDHRVDFSADGKSATVTVPAAKLDDFYTSTSGPVAAKIDTQGAEPMVIASGPKILAQATLVLMEFWPHGMRSIGTDPEKVIDFIGSFATVAVVEGESNEAPVYGSPAQACAQMRELLKDEAPRYLDVIARR